MPKGAKPYPYNRAPKTGGMPPMGKPKASAPKKKASAPRKAPASKATPRMAPKPSPWFDPKTGRAVKAAETAARPAARAVAAGAARGATAGSRAGVVGAAAGLLVGAIGGAMEARRRSGGLFGGPDRGRGTTMGKGPTTRPKGPSSPSKGPSARNKGTSYPRQSSQSTASEPQTVPKTSTNAAAYKVAATSAEKADFRKTFREARKGGKGSFMWQGRSYNTKLR